MTHWVLRFADGSVVEGQYVDDKQHGHWVWRFANGSVDEGQYVNGKKHGHWFARRRADGDVVKTCWKNGNKVDC